jgi:hypothetical protein
MPRRPIGISNLIIRHGWQGAAIPNNRRCITRGAPEARTPCLRKMQGARARARAPLTPATRRHASPLPGPLRPRRHLRNSRAGRIAVRAISMLPLRVARVRADIRGFYEGESEAGRFAGSMVVTPVIYCPLFSAADISERATTVSIFFAPRLALSRFLNCNFRRPSARPPPAPPSNPATRCRRL